MPIDVNKALCVFVVVVPVGVVLCLAVLLLAAVVAILLLQRRRNKMAIPAGCPRNNQTVGANNQRTRESYGKSHVNPGFVSDAQQQLYSNVQDNDTKKTASAKAGTGESKEQIYQNVTFGQGNTEAKHATEQSENDADEYYDDIRCHMDIGEETREQPLYDEPCAVIEMEAEKEQLDNTTMTNANTPDEVKDGPHKKPPMPLPRKPSLKPKPKRWKSVKAAVSTSGSFKKVTNEKQAETSESDVTLVENDIYTTK